MKLLSLNKRKIIFIGIGIFVLVIGIYVTSSILMPDHITIIEGEDYKSNLKSPFLVSIIPDFEGLTNIKKANPNDTFLSNQIIKSNNKGNINLNLKLLGLIPFKTVHVNVMSAKNLVACGNAIGVKLKIDGILVLAVSDIETSDGKRFSPARNSGIRTGDLILDVNGNKVNDVNDLINEVNKSKGKKIKIKFRHGNSISESELLPRLSSDDQKYHIGLWVRDSAAGIGTLTFYDPESMQFGALGHGVTDIDTGLLTPVQSGEIIESSILAVKKGQQGTPGELKGVFIEDKDNLGNINKNCEHGIYGTINKNSISRIPGKVFPIASRAQVKEGEASILANIDGKVVKEYSINIQKISRNNTNGSKGMLIKITDKRLLDETGGIVQGMSGSPIIQNNKIVGAVTHVLISKPDTGYGIFIETMLKNLNIPKTIDKAS